MGSPRDDMRHERQPGGLGSEFSGHIDAIVRAAEREALAAERAIEQRRRQAEDEVRRYLAASRLQVDAEAAARAARLEVLSGAARRLADELTDAAAALNAELARGDDGLGGIVPPAPWPAARADAPEPPAAAAHQPPAREPQAAAAYPPPAAAPDFPPADAAQPAREPAPEPQRATWARVSTREQEAPRDEPRPPAPPSGEITNAARLVAIEMAVGGSPRAEVDEHLRSRFGVEQTAPLLDDVFGAESHAGSRLSWGEP